MRVSNEELKFAVQLVHFRVEESTEPKNKVEMKELLGIQNFHWSQVLSYSTSEGIDSPKAGFLLFPCFSLFPFPMPMPFPFPIAYIGSAEMQN